MLEGAPELQPLTDLLERAEQAIYVDTQEAEALAGELLRRSEGEEAAAALRVRAQVVQLICLAIQGAHPQVLGGALELLDQASALGEHEAEARLHNLCGVTLDFLGLHERSLESYGACLALRRSQGEPYAIARVLGNIGVVLARDSDHEGAIAHYEEALALGREHGFLEKLSRHRLNLVLSLRTVGRVEEARGAAQTALRDATRAGHRLTLPFIHMEMAEAALSEGDAARARHEAELALEGAQADSLPEVEAPARLLLARCSRSAGDARAAQAAAEQALAHATRAGDVVLEQRCRTELSACLEARGELAEALAEHRRANEIKERIWRERNREQRASLHVLHEVELLRSQREALTAERAALEQANRHLTALNRELEDLMAIASHDLRTPLSTAMMVLELFDPDAPRDELERRRVTLQAACERTLSIVELLLEGHRVDQDVTPFANEPLDLPAHVRAALDAATPRAEAKGITLRWEDEGCPQAMGDPRALDQILDNLLSNAIKFSPPGGQVRLTLRPHGARAELEVSDTGPGLTGDDMQRVFRKYARLSARPTGGEPSIGLGLFIVQRLAKRMNGKAFAGNHPSGGASFRVQLPSA